MKKYDAKGRAKRLKSDIYALYFAYRHPKTPWHAKLVIALTMAYALSPIDLIPDFLPIIGYLDDLIIVPAGISLSIKLIPEDVMAECRGRAHDEEISNRLKWGVTALILLFWLVIAYLLIKLILNL